MKFNMLFSSAAFLMLATPALAQSTPAPTQPNAPPAQRMGPFEMNDTNKDGVLTREEVRAARVAGFDRLDTSRDGFLTLEEMRTARMGGPMEERRLRPMGGPERLMERPMGHRLKLEDMDANKDGAVTRQEFDAARARVEAEHRAKSAERREQAFDRLDTNKDGRITTEEMTALRAMVQSKMAERRVQRPVQGPVQGRGTAGGPLGRIDTSGDGKISKDEWLARPDPMFDRGDANKDGRLTREEAAAAYRSRVAERKGAGRPW
jgi:Ca2+-binding EF-hand superfamily protein